MKILTNSDQPEPEKIALSEEQKAIVLDKYLAMDLGTLTRLVFGNEKLDGRCNEGKAIKLFLTEAKGSEVKLQTTKFAPTGTKITLTEDQKSFIRTNIITSKPLELTRLMFGRPELGPLSREFKAVYAYAKEISPDELEFADELVEEREYKPPAALQHVIHKVNQYVTTSEAKGIYSFDHLKPIEEKNLRSLLSYMKTVRFCFQATQYQKRMDRILFESTFVRFVYDKPGLPAEEVDQYISLSAETVSIATIERQVQSFEKVITEKLEGDNESQKISLSLVELVNTSRAKLDQSKERHRRLVDSLVVSRSDRIASRIEQNASVLNLFSAWQNKKHRMELIELGIQEHKEDAEEALRLEGMEDVMALISGLTKEEMIGGL